MNGVGEWGLGHISTDRKRKGDRQTATRDRMGWVWSQMMQAEARRDLLLELLESESGPWQPDEANPLILNAPIKEATNKKQRGGFFSEVPRGRGTHREAQRPHLKFTLEVLTGEV